jgi:hypothetical protein
MNWEAQKVNLNQIPKEIQFNKYKLKDSIIRG